MKTRLLLGLAVLMFAGFFCPTEAFASQPFWNFVAHRRAPYLSWHGRYYHMAYGKPIALVVPPTAEMQTDWTWGVSGTRITPIWHQFGRPYPGPVYGGGPFWPTPPWPSDTNQFGVYYVRGPW